MSYYTVDTRCREPPLQRAQSETRSRRTPSGIDEKSRLPTRLQHIATSLPVESTPRNDEHDPGPGGKRARTPLRTMTPHDTHSVRTGTLRGTPF